MTTAEPLTPAEEALRRAVMRIVKVLPQNLDSDLVRGAGLTASEYATMMHRSEAPNRELQMAYLARATDLSASRITRLVDDLQSGGLVTKTVSFADTRGNIARLTPAGDLLRIDQDLLKLRDGRWLASGDSFTVDNTVGSP